MDQPLYRYMAKVLNVTAGDTVRLKIDLGFNKIWTAYANLYGAYALDLKSPEPATRAKAIAAKEYLAGRLPIGTQVYLIGYGIGQNKSPMVDVFYKGVNIGKEMLDQGYIFENKKVKTKKQHGPISRSNK